MEQQSSTGKWDMRVYYDGDCPLCRREINWLRNRTDSERIIFEDLNASNCTASEYGLTRDQLMERIHGVLPDGQVIEGMEVFRQVYKSAGLGWLLAPTRLPILRPAFDHLYQLFADNRLRLTGRGKLCDDGHCHMPDEE